MARLPGAPRGSLSSVFIPAGRLGNPINRVVPQFEICPVAVGPRWSLKEASNQMSETWEEAILRIVRAKNGEISLQEIYREMEHNHTRNYGTVSPTIIIGFALRWPSSGAVERSGALAAGATF